MSVKIIDPDTVVSTCKRVSQHVDLSKHAAALGQLLADLQFFQSLADHLLFSPVREVEAKHVVILR